ncbi:nuclear transport factor 2 family protein [Nocardioides hwasunensis]|uniref:Nuclear transport factor 2 family protein n=1 Tax=Nocardioides hwasunensis TaxID=397258 RepID=A0ABR8MI13_9ACTN|nr:nuclear transport factor 2 family protein [Nocardioides hwasunensis]MBD3915623.1 nuclear transport factor 2 family protein [Nocardioides hwasunensis]
MSVPASSTKLLEHLSARVRELEDVREIEALAARYHSLCDGGWRGPSHEDVDALVDLWVPDGTYDINAARPPCRGHAEIREQLVRLRTSMPWILHTFTNSEIDVEGDRASGRFKAVAYYRRSDEAHVVVGSYLGDFVRTPAGWRFGSWTADLAHGSVLSAGPSPAAARS